MLTQLKLDWKLNKNSFLLTLLVYPAMFLFGIGFLALLLWLDEETTGWFCMGTIMSLLIPLIFSVLGGMFYPQSFNLALSMGRTRRDFMASYALRQLAWLVCGYVLILIFHQIELTLAPTLLGAYGEDDVPMGFLTDWRIILPAMLIMVLVNMFTGSLYCRFGKATGVVLYVVWMAGCMGLPRLLHEDSPFLALVQAVPTPAWIALAIAALAAMLAFTVTQGKKQAVR